MYFVRDKTPEGVLSACKQFCADFAHELRQNGGKITRWHTDNGGEFTSASLDEFCANLAVRRSFSVPHLPSQNAIAERAWGTILRPMRVLLAASGMPESFWNFAMHHAVYVHNRLPTRGLTPLMSPYHKLYGRMPDLGSLRVWGCLCFVRLEKSQRAQPSTKVSPLGVQAVHVGMDPRRKAYFAYIPSLGRVASVYHITFNERRFIPVRMLSQEEVPKEPPRVSIRASEPPMQCAPVSYTHLTLPTRLPG